MKEPGTDDDPPIADVLLAPAREGTHGARKDDLVRAWRRHTGAGVVDNLFARDRHDQLGIGSGGDRLLGRACTVQKPAHLLAYPCDNPPRDEPNAVTEQGAPRSLDRGSFRFAILQLEVGRVRMLAARLPDHDVNLGGPDPDHGGQQRRTVSRHPVPSPRGVRMTSVTLRTRSGPSTVQG
jgi:hypothetical protein